MANRYLFDGPDPKPKGMGVRGLKPRKDGSQESPLKWAGSKAKPHYLDPLHRIVASLGADTFYDPMFGGGNLSLNAGAKNVVGADRDRNLINAFNQIKNAKGGLEVDWSEFTGKGIDPSAVAGGKAREQVAMPGEISKPTFFGDDFTHGGADFSTYTGPTLRGSTKNPQEGSLNYMLDMANRGELDDDGYKRLAQLWLMTQQSSLQGFTRYNPQGRYSMTRGAAGPYADIWNYRHYQPMMENFDLDAMPVDEFLRDKEIDTKRGVMGIDPPYEGEQAGYGDKFDMASGQQQQLARQLGELAEDGMPIIAYNSPLVADLYRDQGFSTMLNRRRDNTATVGNRGIKPELIATANIPNFDAAEYFRNHPQQQFLGTPEETMAWEQRFGEAFNPDDWLGKAEFFPDGIDPQTIIRRSIVNDLTEMADILNKAIAPAPEPVSFTEHDFFLFSHMMDDGEISKEDEDDLLSRIPSPSAQMTPEEKAARMKVMDYPITGMELTPFGRGELDAKKKIQRRMIREMAGAKPDSKSSFPVSWTSKMPGPAFNTSTDFCQAGSRMRDEEGSVCRDCNVHYNKRYGAPTVQAAMQRRYDRMMSDPQGWGRAMASLIPQYAQMMMEDKTMMPLDRDYGSIDDRHGYMRWHDSGDLQGPQHLALLADIARATPTVNHWLPTKEWGHVYEYIKAGGDIPENMIVRMSMPQVGQAPKLPAALAAHPRIKTSTVGRSQIDPNYSGYVCPASQSGSSGCVDEECNACWRGDFDNIDYEAELDGVKGKLPMFDRLSSQMQREYEQLNPAIPQEIWHDENAFNEFVSSNEGSAMIDRVLRRS